jgi:NADH dehydrogenase
VQPSLMERMSESSDLAMSSTANRVLIVGGGYAGVNAAIAAQQRGVDVTIVDPTGRHDFVTRLAAVAGGSAPVGDASVPLDQLICGENDEVVVDRVVSVVDGSVELASGRSLKGAALVVTAGASSVQPPIDGIEFALPLRTAEDALRLRSEISTVDAVVIVGGGPTGVQLAGAISYTQPEMTVTLVEREPVLLPSMSRGLGRNAARILSERGVSVLHGSIKSIDETGAELSDGTRCDGLVVWAAGFAAVGNDLGLDTLQDDGRILVTDQMAVSGLDLTFAAGDVAAHLDSSGQQFSMSAQIAVQAGTEAGKNAARLILGEPLESVKLRQRGWVLDLSGQRGLAELGPFAFDRPILDLVPPLLHWAIDVKHVYEILGRRATGYFPGCGGTPDAG